MKKIDKSALYVGEKGTYLDCVLKEKPDEYGNQGFVSQSLLKEARGRGERGPIIGNWKFAGVAKPPPVSKDDPLPDSDDIPF